jgi:hypothetical protein
MPAQGTEYVLLLRKTSDSETSLPAEDADLLFDEAESNYSGYSRSVILQAVVVARLTELWTEAAKHVTYQTNELRESLSDIAKALEKRLDKAEAKMEELLNLEKGVALRTAVMKPVPTRRKTYPNG